MYEKLKHFLPQCDEERNKINKESRHKKELQSSFAVLCPPGQHRVTPGWSWTRSWELSSGGFLMTNNNHRPPFSECVCVCPACQAAQARPLLSAPFSRKWIKWSVSKIYVAGDAANNHKKRTAAIFDNFQLRMRGAGHAHPQSLQQMPVSCKKRSKYK